MTLTLTLSPPPAPAPDARLTLWLRGYTDPASSPDHRLAVAANGTPLGEITWDGAAAVTATFPLPATAPVSGANAIALSLPGLPGVSVEGAWLDAAALRYAVTEAGTETLVLEGEAGRRAYTLTLPAATPVAVYDITDPARPAIVTGTRRTTTTLAFGDAAPGPARYLLVPGDAVRTPSPCSPPAPWPNRPAARTTFSSPRRPSSPP